jgi:hypothetical protein
LWKGLYKPFPQHKNWVNVWGENFHKINTLVTAPEAELTFIYLGTSSGLVFNQVLDGTAPGINNVIGSGDFNGDGLDDLAVGAPDSGLSGQVNISFGISSGLFTTQILEPVAVF